MNNTHIHIGWIFIVCYGYWSGLVVTVKNRFSNNWIKYGLREDRATGMDDLIRLT